MYRRTVFLRLASIGVLSFTLNARITDCDEEERFCGNCNNITVSAFPPTNVRRILKLTVVL